MESWVAKTVSGAWEGGDGRGSFGGNNGKR